MLLALLTWMFTVPFLLHNRKHSEVNFDFADDCPLSIRQNILHFNLKVLSALHNVESDDFVPDWVVRRGNFLSARGISFNV